MMIDIQPFCRSLLLGLLLGVIPAAGAEAPSAPEGARPAEAPAAVALRDAAAVEAELEDVVLLEALRVLRLTDAQQSQILPLARGVHERLREAEAEEARRLVSLKETVGATRQRLLAGETVSSTVANQLRLAGQAALRRRTRLEQDLARTTGAQLARLLTPAQMEAVYSLTQATNFGPGASPLLQGLGISRQGAGRTPEEEYRRQHADLASDLRSWRGRGRERDDLIREMTRGIPRNSPQYEPARLQAAAFLDQLRAMPEAAYQQQSNALLVRMARDAIAVRQQEDRAKFLAAQSPAQLATWLEPFVRRVFFSPRIVPALEALVGQTTPAATTARQ